MRTYECKEAKVTLKSETLGKVTHDTVKHLIVEMDLGDVMDADCTHKLFITNESKKAISITTVTIYPNSVTNRKTGKTQAKTVRRTRTIEAGKTAQFKLPFRQYDSVDFQVNGWTLQMTE